MALRASLIHLSLWNYFHNIYPTETTCPVYSAVGRGAPGRLFPSLPGQCPPDCECCTCAVLLGPQGQQEDQAKVGLDSGSLFGSALIPRASPGHKGCAAEREDANCSPLLNSRRCLGKVMCSSHTWHQGLIPCKTVLLAASTCSPLKWRVPCLSPHLLDKEAFQQWRCLNTTGYFN